MSAHKSHLAILLWAAGPDRPDLCAAPFVYATTAAAVDCQVEIHFAGRSVRLLVAGEAAQLFPCPGGDASIYHFMRQAADLGVRFLACAMALKTHIGAEERLIPEYAATAGAAAFIQRSLDPDWATLVF